RRGVVSNALLRGARIFFSAAILIAAAALPGTARAETFLNPNSIHIPGAFMGAATPFPSTISVAGRTGTTTKATVTLIDVDSGGNSDELDLVLVGPGGQKVVLWS